MCPRLRPGGRVAKDRSVLGGRQAGWLTGWLQVCANNFIHSIASGDPSIFFLVLRASEMPVHFLLSP